MVEAAVVAGDGAGFSNDAAGKASDVGEVAELGVVCEPSVALGIGDRVLKAAIPELGKVFDDPAAREPGGEASDAGDVD